MSTPAETTGGSHTFSDGVKVSWTPSTTANEVTLTIEIGGTQVWTQEVEGDGTARVEAEGDNYKIDGDLSVVFNSSGKGGQVLAVKLAWTVKGDSHNYSGWVGSW